MINYPSTDVLDGKKLISREAREREKENGEGEWEKRYKRWMERKEEEKKQPLLRSQFGLA